MFNKIEYRKVITKGSMMESELNKLGSQGWDNYAIDGNTFYFKRVAQKEIKENAVKGKR